MIGVLRPTCRCTSLTRGAWSDPQKNENKLKQIDEIGQILVARALDDTKTIGKTAADIFAKSGLEKPSKHKEKLGDSPDFSKFFFWI